MSAREDFMAAAEASLQAMLPARIVDRGLMDPADLGDAAMVQGLFTLVADGMGDWVNHSGREGEDGTLRFAIVFYGKLDPANPANEVKPTLKVEQMEAQAEHEILEWCRALKPAPLNTVYPRRSAYSKGLECPAGWVVMEMEALYV
ncbi:MAG: hypothetical protein K2W93_14630 [Burkholderiaceae bacterium]|nr:hypothetical protein [Burkholderiaceae bacterium]